MGSTLRGVLSTLAADTWSIGQEHLSASPDPMCRWTSFTERLTTTARRPLRPSQGPSGAPAANLGPEYAPSRPRQVGRKKTEWPTFRAFVGG